MTHSNRTLSWTRPVRRFTSASLRARLTLAIMLAVGLTALVLSYFAYTRTRRSTDFLSRQLQTTVREQTAQQLNAVALQEAKAVEKFLQATTDDIVTVAAYMSALLAQEPILGQGDYWDARQELVRLSAGQWDNPNTDVASVYIPPTERLTAATVSEINAGLYLDFGVPGILQANPNVVAIYFINPGGATIYYPNIDLAKIVEDFDPTTEAWYAGACPENNPGREPIWTEPYQDPALTGLLVTVSAPVYDQAGAFRGVVGADVQLARITEDVARMQVAQTGYAFLIDAAGRPIAMPEAAYQDFGLTPEEVPIGETPQQTVLGKGASDLQDVTRRMVAGESGLATVKIGDGERYVAYAPLSSVAYSLGVVVPVDEMNVPFIAANARIADETTTTQRVGAIILGLVLLLAWLVSLGFGRVLTAPLEHLTQTAQKVAAGNLDVEARVSTRDEIGTLATTFNDMTAQLRDSIGMLEQRVAERTRALETSAEISRRLSALLDQEQLVIEVVEQIQAAFGYYHVHIYLVDENSGDLRVAGGTGKAGQALLAGGHKIPRGKGLMGRAATTNAVVLVPDVSQDADWLSHPLLPDTRSEVVVPIASGGRVLGVLDVQHHEVGGLSEDDANLLGAVASQVAIALQNTRAFAETRQRAEHEALVGQIAQHIQGTLTIEDALQTAARELGHALGAQRASVQLALAAQPAHGRE